MPQFYLDSSNFATATAVYVDAGLTVLAPDGYYSSHGIVRSQVNGQLSAYAECESCKEYQKPVEGELLLDLYPGAVAAFSLNQLSTSYTGAAVRVRRASDSVEQDIGFTSEFVLDVAALDSFCSGTDGFVVTWYNQDGSGNDLTQTTTGNQPKVYDAATSSVLEPTFNGTTRYITDSGVATALSGEDVPMSMFAVFNAATNATQLFYGLGSSVNHRPQRNVFLLSTNDKYAFFFRDDTNTTSGIQEGTSSIITGQNVLVDYVSDGTAHSVNLNGSNEITHTGDVGTLTLDRLALGASVRTSVGDYFDGTISAFIIYTADKSADRAGIENALNQQYNIYWDGTVTALLDDYPGAVGAFSVRALNSFYTGPIMRVRRSSDSAEQDIKALYSGDLDTAALATFCAGTDGFAVRWYDQSGNANDATQTSTSVQPKIYDASTGINLLNSLPAVYFNSDALAASSINTANITLVFAGNMGGGGATNRPWGVASGTSLKESMLIAQDNSLRYDGGFSAGSLAATNNQIVRFSTRTTSAQTDHINSVQNINDNQTLPNSSGVIQVGATSNTFYVGNAQELILYPSDQSANRAGIESNINTYYSIY